jgi:hypothetical protein
MGRRTNRVTKHCCSYNAIIPPHVLTTLQKRANLDKLKKELETVNGKINESTGALQEAQEGREDTVSWRIPGS